MNTSIKTKIGSFFQAYKAYKNIEEQDSYQIKGKKTATKLNTLIICAKQFVIRNF